MATYDYLLEKLHNFISGTMMSEDPENAYLLFHLIELPLSEAKFHDEQAREWAETIKRVGAVSDDDHTDPRAEKLGAGPVHFARMTKDDKLFLREAIWELAGHIRHYER